MLSLSEGREVVIHQHHHLSGWLAGVDTHGVWGAVLSSEIVYYRCINSLGF